MENTNEKETDYAAKKPVATVTKKPRRRAESPALNKYNKWRKVYKALKLQKELTEAGMAGFTFSSAKEAQMKRAKTKMNKAKKIAAPELLKRARRSAMSRNRGGGAGARLAKR